MRTVEYCNSAQAIHGLLEILQTKSPIVDLTYGNGNFWTESSPRIIGIDINPARAKDCVASFFNLPFSNNSIPTVIFDPPFHPTGSGSIELERFGGIGYNHTDMKELFIRGVSEAWRITKDFLIVKCQHYIHNHTPQWMPLWAIQTCGDPYEWMVTVRPSKIISGRWKSNRFLRRIHADWLVFSKHGNVR